MSDLATLIQILEANLPTIRRDMAPADWAAFTARLAEAAPFFEQAADDPDARLEALYLLERACGQFAATRRILPPPGGALVQTAPEPAARDPVTGLPAGPLAQKEPDIAELMQRALALCRDPNGVADRPDAPAAPTQD